MAEIGLLLPDNLNKFSFEDINEKAPSNFDSAFIFLMNE